MAGGNPHAGRSRDGEHTARLNSLSHTGQNEKAVLGIRVRVKWKLMVSWHTNQNGQDVVGPCHGSKDYGTLELTGFYESLLKGFDNQHCLPRPF